MIALVLLLACGPKTPAAPGTGPAERAATAALARAIPPTGPITYNRVVNLGTLNSTIVNGDNLTRSLLPAPAILPVTFRLWVNKELVFQGTVSSSDVFRLPSGYRSDTFEVGVSGSARVRAIHIGETPFGLRVA